MQIEFQIGTVVQLKSGGPKMTIAGHSAKYENYLVCQFFAAEELKTLHVSPNVLKKVVDKE